jgi:hypothetical protein
MEVPGAVPMPGQKGQKAVQNHPKELFGGVRGFSEGNLRRRFKEWGASGLS